MAGTVDAEVAEVERVEVATERDVEPGTTAVDV